MKLVCISDTHTYHNALTLPEGDVLVHAGDGTLRGTRAETLDFLNWLGSRKGYRAKLLVPGNHDFFFESNYSTTEILCIERGIKLLVDKRFTLDDGERTVKFYGSPWVPNLQMWAYYGDHTTLISRFAKIPNDTDVLITHGPPWGILDKGAHHYGSTELAERVHELNLRAHIFGHVHESYGVEDHGAGRYSVNACSCNIEYKCVNPPIVVDI